MSLAGVLKEREAKLKALKQDALEEDFLKAYALLLKDSISKGDEDWIGILYLITLKSD